MSVFQTSTTWNGVVKHNLVLHSGILKSSFFPVGRSIYEENFSHFSPLVSFSYLDVLNAVLYRWGSYFGTKIRGRIVNYREFKPVYAGYTMHFTQMTEAKWGVQTVASKKIPDFGRVIPN